MTIKQQGGVFGRNPTFNDVTIEGQLTFDGDIDINSDLKVSGDIETTGNVIIGTSGNGIDFSATAGTGTSELFDDYEEGTYTIEAYDATVGGNQSATTATGYYTKVGRQVFVSGALSNIDTTGLTSGNNVYLSLPFASSSSLSAFHPSSVAVNTIGFNTGSAPFLRMSPGTVFAVLAANKDGAAPVSITWGNLNTGAATSDIIISISYFV